MNNSIKSILIFITVIFLLGIITSCEDFFNPDQDIYITEENFYADWYEYRAAAMGMYTLQQELVEQLVVLGELRGDLLKVTDNASSELMEIYNFNVSRENKYASPQNFFKLIAVTNRIISVLEREYPQVLDPAVAVNNYDRLYGEALTMRAWAYFNAVRIYGKVPFIDQRLSTIEEIEAFISSPGSYTDKVYVVYGIDGYANDTIYDQEVVLEKNYFDTERVIRHFTYELENKVKAVGVNHYIDNNDDSWEVTVWSQWSYHTLLGHMFLTLGDLNKSAYYFEKVVLNNSENRRYQLDDAFAGGQWQNIFLNIDSREHIYTLWFDKASQQQNGLQQLFEPFGSNEYMLMPTSAAVHKWETVWRGMNIRYDYTTPDSTKTINPGIPSDFYRGYGASYLYARNGMPLFAYFQMLEHKMNGEDRSVENLMENMDTLVYKYSINKDRFDQDANFIIYRAAGVNLYLAEIYNFLRSVDTTGIVRSFTQRGLNIINNGSNYNPTVNRNQLGVRGRVGLPPFVIQDYRFIFNPFTNKVEGYINLTGNLRQKQLYFENDIMEERARELAFEGERFYDLMRVAKRRNDPSYLASRVSEKYSGSQREQVYNLLLNENNWYINYFE